MADAPDLGSGASRRGGSSPSFRTIAYVTYLGASGVEDPDTDRELVMSALQESGAQVASVVWDDPTIDWSSFDLVVVRSTWDYVEKYHEFRQWLIDVDQVTTLLNPRMIIEPNLVKTYLRELEGTGISIVPTQWISDVDQLRFTGDMVVKPVISAGAADTIRTSDEAHARAHADHIIRSGRIAMVQPYLNEVDSVGEISIVCIDATPRWAVRKIPALTQGGNGGARECVELTDEVRTFAQQVLAASPGAEESLYARVDVVPTQRGLALMELELAEPSLFIPLAPENAAGLFAEAILKRLPTS